MVLSLNKKGFVKIIIPLTMVLFVIVNFLWSDKGIRTKTIDGDGRGHYIYLTLIFIDHSIDFKDLFEKEKKGRNGYIGHNFHRVNNVFINKFPIGTSILILPFFISAHILAKLFGFEANGFSLPYQYAVAFAALFWLLTGLFYLKQLLKIYNIPERFIIISLFFLIVSTNLFHYAFVEPSMSHVYSFSIISIFLFYSKKLFNNPNSFNLFISALLFGIIILIRQANGLILLAIPFLANDRNNFVKTLKLIFIKPANVLILLTGIILGFMPQMIINILQTGKPYIYGYINEGFFFLHPQIIKFLFSFQKGWFIYTPSMLLIIPASIGLYKLSRYHFYTFIVFIILLIYVFSSWWNWFFGDSFGMRPMVDYYSIFTLIIILWAYKLKPFAKKVILFFLFLTSILNILQSYQYSKGIIHVDSMDFKAYKYVLFKISDKYRNCIGADDEYFYGTLSKPIIKSKSSFLLKKEGWDNPAKKLVKKDMVGYYELLNNKIIFGPSYTYRVNKSMTDKRLYLKLYARYSEIDKNASKQALFVIDIKNEKGDNVFYKAFSLKKVPDDITGKTIIKKTGVKLPPLKPDYIIKTYIWNKGKNRLKLYEMGLSLHEIYPCKGDLKKNISN